MRTQADVSRRRRAWTSGVLAWSAVLWGLPGPAWSDEDVVLKAGQRVRVTLGQPLPGIAGAGDTLEGSVQSIDENHMVVARPASADTTQTVTVPRAAIHQLDVQERAGNHGRAALYGGLVGLGVGLVAVAAASGGSVNQNGYGPSSAGAAALLVGILGAPVGALVGVACGHDGEWRTKVPLGGIRLAVAPTQGHGTRIAFTKTF
jgi:hypothetical protein